jgi:hypothetical protein
MPENNVEQAIPLVAPLHSKADNVKNTFFTRDAMQFCSYVTKMNCVLLIPLDCTG